MIEFALSIPFLFLIVVSIIYLGRYFLIAQMLLYAAQEGAKVAAITPNLSNSTTRDMVRGFNINGGTANTNSIIYSALASAGLLSNGLNNPSTTGILPPGASVQILPWDANGTTTYVPPSGTVAVVINYPFSLLVNPFTGQTPGSVKSVSIAMSFTDPPLPFLDFTVSERAIAAQQIYQQ